MGHLLDTLSTTVPADQLDTLARLLGDTPEVTGRTLKTSATALLAILATRAAHGGMDEVMALTGPLLAHGNPLDQFAAGLADTSVRATQLEDGHAMASGLLGPLEGPLAGALAAETGARAHTIAQILKLAGPIALGAATRHLGQPPTADALAALLEAERPALVGALPPRIASLVGTTAAEQTPLHGTPVEGAAGSASSAGRWVPWLAAVVVGIAVLAGLRNAQSPDKAVSAPAAPASAIITEATPVLARATLPDGSVLMLAEGSAALELARFLSGSEPAPRAFRFEELGTAPTDGGFDARGEEAVRAVARVLESWPSARVRIEGHTDSQGEADSNLAASTRRADAVKTLLAQAGIDAGRVAAEGLGEEAPIATNETAEGRAQNRRTVIVVTGK
jgi:hypothetical protein